jgi:hypothetical protein
MMRTILISLAATTLAAIAAVAQPSSFRPPATPLIAVDPYFSLWSFSDRLTDDWSRHWTGANQALCMLVRIDGKPFRIMGREPWTYKAPPMNQKEFTLTPTRSVYAFEEGGVAITLTFMTPALPQSLSVYSRPVGYVTWQVRAIDGKSHAVALYLDASGEFVVNTPDQQVSWARVNVDGLDVLKMGSQDQRVLGRSGDDLRIDWGYLYMVSPKSQKATSGFGDHQMMRRRFGVDGALPTTDDLRMPRPAQDDWPVMAMAFDCGNVGASAVERFLVLAYDDMFSIEFLQRRLMPYWRIDGSTTVDLLLRSVREYPDILRSCTALDRELTEDLSSAGGEEYARLATLAYREAIAAHKLAADIDGSPLLFPKENFSNGCISTVDVIYPAAPIFLLFNVELEKASLRPVLQYAMTKRWRFDFAPHDVGTYPLANGQVYGGGERGEENQMPVEESGNMLLLMYAIAKVDGHADFAGPYWPALRKWAAYLKSKGFDPENQLCTDDFAGHLAHNVNLSLKAILALGAYGRLCAMAGKKEESTEYVTLALDMARRWQSLADDGDHFRLAFDKPGTWSQKYNLVWDRILDLNLFPSNVGEKEITFYKMKLNTYGLPLDNRKDYTKLDWIVWSATIASRREDFQEIIHGAYAYAHSTPDRVPLSDWYDTKTARQVAFQARPVVGGVFMKMLSDPAMWTKWSSKAPR